MEHSIHFIEELTRSFTKMKTLGDKTIEQLSFDQLAQSFDTESNSIAILVKHISGNMKSRWTNFLVEDGEKEWRERDAEFVNSFASKEELKVCWEEGWSVLFGALSLLDATNIDTIIYIRKEPHTVTQAMMRQHQHYAYHTGQIVQLAKHILGENWQSLSIPKGKSDDYKDSAGEYRYT